MAEHFGYELPFGADLRPDGRVRFRLWAPAQKAVSVVIAAEGGEQMLPLMGRDSGWFETIIEHASAGTRYQYLLGDGARVPDPASRFQPDDVHGCSEVIDPRDYAWRHGAWAGRPWEETVLYEAHIGGFTPGGDFDGARAKLDHLVRLGVTALELMPIADFEGRRNWGYDGVLPFAPASAYGRPNDLKRLIDEAHGRGLMVFLDVVYNHFGPSGNYLARYAPAFFTERHHTPWGGAINFDGSDARPVRDFFIHNALYWLDEYRFDGLRFDAVHAIRDDSRPDILEELATTVRGHIGAARHVHLVLENDANSARYLERDAERRPRFYTAQWNDDFHHAAHVLVTGESEGHYADYARSPVAALGRALAEGFVYQGEASAFRGGEPRGEPSAHLPPTAFVAFLQNHDQIGNRAFGDRLDAVAAAAARRALTAILLLSPQIPMLFMGEEWGSRRPFLFFCDFGDELADAVREGRRREFARFSEFRDPAARARIPDPNALDTFAISRLDWREGETAARSGDIAFLRGLIALRRRAIMPLLAGTDGGGRHRMAGDHRLQVEWPLARGARLHLAANLSAEAAPALPWALPGECLYSAPGNSPNAPLPNAMAPWEVRFTLDAAGDAVVPKEAQPPAARR